MLNRFFNNLLPPSHGTRFPALDGLRTIACIGVMLAHLPFSGGSSTNPFACTGAVSVGIFLSLSAFLLYKPIVDGRNFSIWKFYGRRFFRIYPLYIIAILLTWHIVPRNIHSDAIALIANLSLFQSLHADWSKAIIPPLYFLSALFHFYLIFPFAILVIRKNIHFALIIGILIIFTSQIIGFLVPPSIYHRTVFSFMPILICGIIAAQFSRLRVPCWFAVIGLLLITLHLIAYFPLARFRVWQLAIIHGPLLGIACSILIISLCNNSDSLVFNFFSLKFLRILAPATYGAFLFHFLVRWSLVKLTGTHVSAWIMIPMSFSIGIASYYLIEKRFL